jgi:hypothetical protein
MGHVWGTGHGPGVFPEHDTPVRNPAVYDARHLPHPGEDLRSIREGGIATQPIEPVWYADIKGRVGGRGGRERINNPSVGTRNMITASGSPTTGASEWARRP